MGETINQWRRGGNRSTQREPITTSFRKTNTARLVFVMLVFVGTTPVLVSARPTQHLWCAPHMLMWGALVLMNNTSVLVCIMSVFVDVTLVLVFTTNMWTCILSVLCVSLLHWCISHVSWFPDLCSCVPHLASYTTVKICYTCLVSQSVTSYTSVKSWSQCNCCQLYNFRLT